MNRVKSQIETVKTASEEPRFDLKVGDMTVRVTRFGTDDKGRTHFELAGRDEPDDLRDVFPTDRGFVEDGEVYMLIETFDDVGGLERSWRHIGYVQSSMLRVGDSVAAELGRCADAGT